MSVPFIDLSTLANHTLAFGKTATALGFSSVGEINRFIFQSYGKALREVPPADRPQGAIFFIAPPGVAGALAPVGSLQPVIRRVQAEVDRNFLVLPLDLAGGATIGHAPTSDEKKVMTCGSWPMGHAQMLSRTTGHCVIWANGVGVIVYLAGDSYLETPDVVEEMPAGLPANFQALSWNNGEIAFEFARHELNDTSPVGIWRLPDHHLLRPKPEKMMSISLGKFLRLRMAGYRHHEDEPYVENEGRADIVLYFYNGFIYIVEVKWVGCSLSSKKELQSTQKIEDALKKKAKGWLTTYGDETFAAGAKQLAKYYSTNRYKRAYLTVFDCLPPAATRKNECPTIDPHHVSPHGIASFRALRACVDPRKASKSSKAKLP